ncbi:hypothetical protein Tco_1237308 [Tanacetum coccineum]
MLSDFKTISFRVLHRTSVSRPQLRSTQMKDKVMQNNSQVKIKQKEVEDHHRILRSNLSNVPSSSNSFANRTNHSINLDNKRFNDTLTAELERYKEQVKVLKEGQNVYLKSKDNVSDSFTLLKNDFKKEESRNIDREIALEKKIKELDNIVYKVDQSAQTKAQQLEPKLYDGNIIKNTSSIVIPDSEETLMLAEESHSKILLKQQDPMVLEKKVNTTPFDYANSMNSSDPSPSFRLTKVEVSKEFLKSTWDEIIPFVKALKDLFNTFDQYLIDELSKVQNVFHQMEQAVEQHRLESKTFEVKMNQVLNENERLLEQVINKDIVNIIMNSTVYNASVNVHECEKCLKLETELLNKKNFIEKETYDKLFRSFTTLEKYCISLEVNTQLNQEIFQRDNYVSNQSAPNFDQYFELNELKVQSQEKDTVIKKLKERIKSLIGNINEDKVKKDIEEIETINIKLDHRVSKLIAENEHLKQTYKQLYDLIKPTINVNARVKSKSIKKGSKRKVWKPIRKVFTNIGYNWRPTGQTFTIVGNASPLTRITTTAEVPPRKPTAPENYTPKQY